MDENFEEEYQNDDLLSDIYPYQDKRSGHSGGRKKSQAWDYFDVDGIRKHGHIGCLCKGCGWKRAVGKAYEMVEHLAFSCPKVSGETKELFLEEIRNRPALKLNHTPSDVNDKNVTKKQKTTQRKLTTMFESSTVEQSKIVRCNRALTWLFVCCRLPFRIISNPFFIDFVKSLCPGYELLNRITFANS